MPQNAFFLGTRDLLGSQKTMQRHFFSTLYPLSMVIFATATVLAFVLLCNSRFNFHCYTQREATPTQKSAWKCAATTRDFLRERLQSAFTLANQLRWIAQYRCRYHRLSHHWKVIYCCYRAVCVCVCVCVCEWMQHCLLWVMIWSTFFLNKKFFPSSSTCWI